MRCYEYKSLKLIDSFNISENALIEANIRKGFTDKHMKQTFISNPTDNQYTDYFILIMKSVSELFLIKDYPYSEINLHKSIPGFLDKIELKELWPKTDYIIDLLGIGSGFLILYNIDGIPKFCITGSDVLSDEVRL